MKQPRAILIAGPNGAGKTTFAHEFLLNEAECLAFINADMIATGLSPFRPERAALQASRLMIQVMEDHVRRRESFAVETTLAAQGYIKRIGEWRKLGYTVILVFLSLPDMEMAIDRVAFRVEQGGHDIPESVVRRRYLAGLRNLEIYKPLVNRWQVFDNSGPAPILLDEGASDDKVE